MNSLFETGYTDAWHGKDNRESYEGQALTNYVLGQEAFHQDWEEEDICER